MVVVDQGNRAMFPLRVRGLVDILLLLIRYHLRLRSWKSENLMACKPRLVDGAQLAVGVLVVQLSLPKTSAGRLERITAPFSTWTQVN